MYQQPKAAAFARSYLHIGVFEGANSERFKGLLHRGCLQDPSINKTKSLAYVIFLSQRASVSASSIQKPSPHLWCPGVKSLVVHGKVQVLRIDGAPERLHAHICPTNKDDIGHGLLEKQCDMIMIMIMMMMIF